MSPKLLYRLGDLPDTVWQIGGKGKTADTVWRIAQGKNQDAVWKVRGCAGTKLMKKKK